MEMGDNPKLSLDLRQVSEDDIIAIKFADDSDLSFLFLRVNKSAGCHKDGLQFGECVDCSIAYCLISREWMKSFICANITVPIIGQKSYILGACTKNPYAIYGFTMLHFHTITIGRHLLWWIGENDSFLFDETVQRVSIMHDDQLQKFIEQVERDGENGPGRYSLDEIEEIKLEVIAEKEKERKWQEFIKQALRIETRNSIYLLGPEKDDGVRTLQKEGADTVLIGKLSKLIKNHGLGFDTKDGHLHTSAVSKIKPIL
jgi:hypothetical protein